MATYVCTQCGTHTRRELLTVKKIVFLEMGMGGRTVRSRVNGWLCPSCIAIDIEWNREAFIKPKPVKNQKHVEVSNGNR